VFADGGLDILTPLIWRLDTFWRSFRDQTPWVTEMPTAYLKDHVRFCFSKLEGPFEAAIAAEWFKQIGKEDLLMFASNYPHWSWAKPRDLPEGLSEQQRQKVLYANARELYNFELAGASL
jgi:predicted TIM-barrel fold metal-dependent hydrolase